MGKALLKGCIFGGIIVFAWMIVSWTVLPWHCWSLKGIENQSAVSEALVNNTSEDGIYVIPSFCGAEWDEMGEKVAEMEKGPFVFMSLKRYGHGPNTGTFVISFIFQLIGALGITFLILKTKGLNYFSKVGLVTLIGFLIGFLGALPYWNWWGFSFGFVFVELLDMVIAWFLAGLVIAAVAKE